MSRTTTPFPQIDYDLAIDLPNVTDRDKVPITQEQISTIEGLVAEINRYITSTLEIGGDVIDELGSTQANKLIRDLKKQRDSIIQAWRASLKGRKEVIKGKGYKIKLTVSEVDEEPTSKQIGYLKHLIEDNSLKGFPEYLLYALDKWEISSLIDAIQGGEKETNPKPKGGAKKDNKVSGCGCLIALIVLGLIIWGIWKLSV